MIKSMTGYGQSCREIGGMNITVEIKSVNHRFFEFSTRASRTYGFLDEKLKSFLQKWISRGKVDCSVTIEALEEADVIVSLNSSLAQGYLKVFGEMSERFDLKNDVTVSSMSRFSDIFSTHKAPADEEKVWDAVKVVAAAAAERFVAMREAEGEKLRGDIIKRAEAILSNVSFIESRSPQTLIEYNEKLTARIRQLLEDAHVDEQRLLTEAAIFADKVAVDEETVRLRCHISQLRELLCSDEAVGRKLDFLTQEINREANTIGSKSQDVEIARSVIDIKAEVEKIREQVQNIE
ncbi:MAG: YicC family protein [Clostridiales bacterium]|nr:YicC family protein [Clostridiales bacterium]